MTSAILHVRFLKCVCAAVAAVLVSGVFADDAARNHSSEMNATRPAERAGTKGGVKVAFLGNSITLHGIAPQIGWTNLWGMAASARERDYVHLVTRGIERETGRSAETIVRNIYDFERDFANYDVRKGLGDVVDFQPDYLVIAMGENVRDLSTPELKEGYRKAFKELLGALLSGRTRPRTVVRGVFWRNAAKDEAMSKVANEFGVPFVRTDDLGSDPAMKAIGLFAHAGVANHPGDKGMAETAARILGAFFPKRPAAVSPRLVLDAPKVAATQRFVDQNLISVNSGWEAESTDGKEAISYVYTFADMPAGTVRFSGGFMLPGRTFTYEFQDAEKRTILRRTTPGGRHQIVRETFRQSGLKYLRLTPECTAPVQKFVSEPLRATVDWALDEPFSYDKPGELPPGWTGTGAAVEALAYNVCEHRDGQGGFERPASDNVLLLAPGAKVTAPADPALLTDRWAFEFDAPAADGDLTVAGVRLKDLYGFVSNVWYHFRFETRGSADAGVARVKMNGRPVADGVRTRGFAFENRGPSAVRVDDVKAFALEDPIDYPAAPVSPKGGEKHLVGINVCSLWHNGYHFGWETVERHGGPKPVLGYYDEGLPETADWEIKYLVEHGVDFQAFCWYAESHEGVLRHPRNDFHLTDGFKNARYSDRMKYCLIWEIQNAGRPHSLESWKRDYVPYFIEHHFKDPRYLAVDGKPVFAVFGGWRFAEARAFGSVATTREAFDYLEAEVRKLGFKGMVFVASNWETSADIAAEGFDATCAYNYRREGYTKEVNVERNLRRAKTPGAYAIPVVSVGFDSKPWHGCRYPMMEPSVLGETLAWCRDTFVPKFAEKGTWQENTYWLSTWNEYGEGTYIMPTDDARGFAYLDAVRATFTDERPDPALNVKPTPRQRARICNLYAPYADRQRAKARFAKRRAKPTAVYVLAGQSNMAGRGALEPGLRVSPERVLKWNAAANRWEEAEEPFHDDWFEEAGAGLGASFARALADADPEAVIGLVPTAEGGTPLSRWEPGADLHKRAVSLTRAALAQGGELKGILWHQGCSDADKPETAGTYAERFEKTVAAFRAELGDVPVVAGELGRYFKKDCPHWRTVNEQLHAAAKRIPRMKVVSSWNLKPKADFVHFDTPSLRTLGIRYAQAVFELDGRLPDVGKWRGVNLLGLFGAPNSTNDPRCAEFTESTFAHLEKWGFNFARLPMDYRHFMPADDWSSRNEAGYAQLDRAVAWGRKHGVHVQICLHRAPGFTIASWKPEPKKLQRDTDAQDAFIELWREFARRYRGIPNAELSFNLVNEPNGFPEKRYVSLFGRALRAIREEDPGRFVMLDGNAVASASVPYFFDVPLTGQAFRGYTPHAISHYGAWYIKDQPPEKPEWPLQASLAGGKKWIYEQPEATLRKFADARAAGYPVMIGEFGCYNKLDHATCLKWMEHCLKLWRAEGLGWAIWNLDGPFGFVDSGRTDVEYEDFDGRKLDRKMLELLRSGMSH